MIQEIKLKFYNNYLGFGYNDFRKVYSSKDNIWIEMKVHAGRLVYGTDRKPFSKLREGITHKNYVIQDYLPF